MVVRVCVQCVEQSPGEVEKSTADRIMQLVKCIKQ